MLLLWLAKKKQDPAAVQAASDIESGIADVLTRMEQVTPDLLGSASTEEMGEAICMAIRGAKS